MNNPFAIKVSDMPAMTYALPSHSPNEIPRHRHEPPLQAIRKLVADLPDDATMTVRELKELLGVA